MSFRAAVKMFPVAAALTFAVLAVGPARGQDGPNPIVARVKAVVKDPSSPFILVVHLRAKEEAGPKIEAAFAKVMKTTRKEKGCRAYELSRDPKHPEQYLLYESWQNLDALEAHLKSPALTALLQEVHEMVAAPPELKILLPAGD